MRLIKSFLTVGLAVMAMSVTQPIYAQELSEEFEVVEDVSTTSMFTTKNVHVRSGPGTGYESYEILPVGTNVQVKNVHLEWAEVFYNDGTAYIYKEYLIETVRLEEYTEEDLEVLAHVIAGEAQCCDDMEQRYVASVVLNRVFHDSYPDTIKEVVFEKNQYACTKDGNYYRDPTESNWENAKYVLENGSVLPSFVIFQSRGIQGKGEFLKTTVHSYCY